MLSAVSATMPLVMRLTKMPSVVPLARQRCGSTSATTIHVKGPMAMLKDAMKAQRRPTTVSPAQFPS